MASGTVMAALVGALSQIRPFRECASDCNYCRRPHNRGRVSYGSAAQRLTPVDYDVLLDEGWMRSGTWLYRPSNDKCCCPNLVVKTEAARFTPSRELIRVMEGFAAVLRGDAPLTLPPLTHDAFARALRLAHVGREMEAADIICRFRERGEDVPTIPPPAAAPAAGDPLLAALVAAAPEVQHHMSAAGGSADGLTPLRLAAVAPGGHVKTLYGHFLVSVAVDVGPASGAAEQVARVTALLRQLVLAVVMTSCLAAVHAGAPAADTAVASSAHPPPWLLKVMAKVTVLPAYGAERKVGKGGRGRGDATTAGTGAGGGSAATAGVGRSDGSDADGDVAMAPPPTAHTAAAAAAAAADCANAVTNAPLALATAATPADGLAGVLSAGIAAAWTSIARFLPALASAGAAPAAATHCPGGFVSAAPPPQWLAAAATPSDATEAALLAAYHHLRQRCLATLLPELERLPRPAPPAPADPDDPTLTYLNAEARPGGREALALRYWRQQEAAEAEGRRLYRADPGNYVFANDENGVAPEPDDVAGRAAAEQRAAIRLRKEIVESAEALREFVRSGVGNGMLALRRRGSIAPPPASASVAAAVAHAAGGSGGDDAHGAEAHVVPAHRTADLPDVTASELEAARAARATPVPGSLPAPPVLLDEATRALHHEWVAPFPAGPHTLTVHLVRPAYTVESHELYARFNMALHRGAPKGNTRRAFLRHLIQSCVTPMPSAGLGFLGALARAMDAGADARLSEAERAAAVHDALAPLLPPPEAAARSAPSSSTAVAAAAVAAAAAPVTPAESAAHAAALRQVARDCSLPPLEPSAQATALLLALAARDYAVAYLLAIMRNNAALYGVAYDEAFGAGTGAGAGGRSAAAAAAALDADSEDDGDDARNAASSRSCNYAIYPLVPLPRALEPVLVMVDDLAAALDKPLIAIVAACYEVAQQLHTAARELAQLRTASSASPAGLRLPAGLPPAFEEAIARQLARGTGAAPAEVARATAEMSAAVTPDAVQNQVCDVALADEVRMTWIVEALQAQLASVSEMLQEAMPSPAATGGLAGAGVGAGAGAGAAAAASGGAASAAHDPLTWFKRFIVPAPDASRYDPASPSAHPATAAAGSELPPWLDGGRDASDSAAAPPLTLPAGSPRIVVDGWDASLGYGSFFHLYRLDGHLVGVSVLDILPTRIASVYFFYDPDFRHLQLGKVSAMVELWLTAKMAQHMAAHPETTTLLPRGQPPPLKWWDANFYVHGVATMSYKRGFQPSWLLCPVIGRNHWVPMDAEALLALDRHPCAALARIPETEEAIARELRGATLGGETARLAEVQRRRHAAVADLSASIAMAEAMEVAEMVDETFMDLPSGAVHPLSALSESSQVLLRRGVERYGRALGPGFMRRYRLNPQWLAGLESRLQSEHRMAQAREAAAAAAAASGGAGTAAAAGGGARGAGAGSDMAGGDAAAMLEQLLAMLHGATGGSGGGSGGGAAGGAGGGSRDG